MSQDTLRGRTIRSWNGEPSAPTPLPAETPFSIGPTSTDGLRARIRQVVEWFGGGAISDEDADAAAGVLYGTPPETPASEDELRGHVPDALVVALAERHLDDGSPCFCEDWIAGSVSPFSTMNSEHADYCERVRAALTRPVSEVPEAAPSSETRRVLERLDRGVTRATRHTDGMVAARTMHLLIAELLREGASDD